MDKKLKLRQNGIDTLWIFAFKFFVFVIMSTATYQGKLYHSFDVLNENIKIHFKTHLKRETYLNEKLFVDFIVNYVWNNYVRYISYFSNHGHDERLSLKSIMSSFWIAMHILPNIS